MKRKIKLSELPLNRSALIVSVECKDSIINRIYDFGIVKDTIITAIFKSPLGDPKAYLIKNTIVALRNDDCEKITIIPI